MSSTPFVMPSFAVPRLKFGLLVSSLCAVAALVGGAGRAEAQCSGAGTTTYTSSGNSSSPTINFSAGSHTPLTSTVNVSLPAGSTITCVSLVLTGVTTDGANHSSMDYASFLLTSPDSRKFQFLGSTGDGTDGDDQNDGNSGLAGVNITVADNASQSAPACCAGLWPHTGSTTVKPSSYYLLAANSTGTTPPLGGGASAWAQSDGTGTFSNIFAGQATPSGTWTLTVTDNNPSTFAGTDPVTVNSWTLVLTTAVTANVNTTTSLSSGTNPSFTNGTSSSVTLTANVSSGGNGTPVGTVQFTDGGSTIVGCGAATLSSGTATCTTTFSTEGIHSITATYSGATGFNLSSGTLNQLVENHTSSPSTDEYCNTAGLSNNGANTAPYPSIINVPSLGGSVAEVSVTLSHMTVTQGFPLGYGFLLVAPDGTHNLDFLDDAGVGGPNSNNVTVTVADGGADAPLSGGLLSATYEPTNNENSAPSFPGSTPPTVAIPGTINYAQPDFFGSSPLTLSQAFSGVNPQGAWSLFYLNNSGTSTPMSVTGGWCLSFEVNNGAPTTTTLSSSENPAFIGDSAVVTATVKNGGSAVTQGTVTIIDTATGTPLTTNAPLNGSGTVSVSVASLTEGDHNLTANYSGVNNTFDPSSGTLWQRMDKRSSETGAGTAGSPAVYCNPAGFVIPGAANLIGAANPNPTNIFVTNLPSTLKSVTVELNGFQTPTDPTIIDTASLLVGPNGKALDFFSGTGASNTMLSNGSYNFADSASNNVPQTAFGPGTYQPTSYNTVDTFFPNASNQYLLPGTIKYSDPHSTAFTLNGPSDGVFTNIDANGVWSLYFNQTIHDVGASATGWCLSFVENALTGTGTTSHTGPNPSNHMAQGGTGSVSFSLLNNGDSNGNGYTGDADGSVAHAMTVTGTLPAGLTLGTVPTGTPWNCTASTSTAVTCTNTNAIAAGSSYQALVIPVHVASNSGATATVSGFTFSGAGMTAGTFSSDTITIDPAAVLAVSKTAVGTFTQGSTGQWNILVSNTSGTASGATSGTVTVQDTMPSGYTILSIVTGAQWNCTTSTSTVLTCTSTAAVAGAGGQFNTITVNVNIPAASATSVTNNVSAWGGGDLTHTSQGTAATAFSTVSVVQVPAHVVITAGSNQSAAVNTAFATNLAARVSDASNVVINGATVTFTAPSSGASGTFASTGTRTATANTDSTGVATASVFTANGTAGGPYSVTVSAGSVSSNFLLTNSQAPGITSANGTTFTQNSPGTFTVTTTGSPAPTLSKTGTLPSGVTFTDNANGTATLAGTPTNSGSFPITITASNGVSPNAMQSFTLTVSSATVTVPNVVGDTLAAATTALTNVGLVVGTTSNQFSNSVPAGEVISQSPVALATVNAGSAVNLVLSNGPQPVATTVQVTSASTASVGGAFSVTVTVKDQFGNVFTGYTGTMHFTSTDATATLPANYTFNSGDAGVHTFSLQFNSAGNWTITATDTVSSALTGTAGPITVGVPSFVVTNTHDTGAGSLRQALLNAASAGSGNVTFDHSDFNTAQTINSASTLVVPSNTTITGPTSGTGQTLTNLVTVAGGGSATDYPVFTVGSGVTAASISGLIITNGHTSGKGGGISNGGALTLTNCTVTGNNSDVWGGGVYSNGPITISGTTMTNNASSIQGGAFVPDGATATITNSTFTGNSSFYGGGIYDVHGTVNLKGVTVAGNHAGYSTNDFYDFGSLTIANTVIGDLNTVNGDTDHGGNIVGNTGLNLAPLGNYGGPTQTMIPLPGSTAICAGTTTNWNALNPKADQRGISTSDPNCASGAVDAGAVQSNYSISLSQDASNVAVNTAMSPAPAIQLDESGSAFTVTATPLPTVTIPLTLTGAGTLTGGSANIEDSTGIATYSSLQIDTASMSDKLRANLTLTSGISPAVVLSVSTSNFEVLGGASSMTANSGTTPQSTTIGTAFTHALAVTVLDSANDPVQGASVTFTAPSTGASGKFSNNTQTITVSTNASGVASAPFTANNTAGGPYTATAAASGLTTVNFSLTNTAGSASTMTANAGTTPQSATVSTAFANALAVTVKDSGSNPVSGVNVTFTVPGSGASGVFSNSTTTITVATNASGVASAPITANGTAGGPYTATAAASGLTTVDFSLTNTAGSASSMTANTGTTPQSATISTAFGNALAVTVKDNSNNPVSGVNVTFSAPGSGASGIFSNSTATITVATNASGVASAPFTANGTTGSYLVSAAAAGLTTVNFSLTNTAGAASTMTANAGTTPQSATVSTAFANALAVTVKDSGSNPVSGVSVTFTVPGSGASGVFSNSTTTITVATNASGVASAPITANGTAGGPYTATAAASGLTTVNFSLTNTAGSASTMTANPGTTPQSATISTAFGNALAVTVKDSSNNPVSGVNVTFTAPGSGASGTFSNSTTTITVATNASGVASAPFTANATAGGPYTATAAASGLTTVNFNLTNTVGSASAMTANAGTTPQSALVNTAFANALAVTVKDSGSNPVSGVNVTFTAPSSGASGTFSNSATSITVATNSSGVASAGITANNTPGGPYTVSASSAGLTSVNFSLTNTPAIISVTCSATNSGMVNMPFSSGAESVSGGVMPYTFFVGSGTVPVGLVLNTATGAVSGTPATSGSFSIKVKDAANTVGATSCPITITAGALVVSWPTPAAITYGTALGATQLDATANVPGTFSYNPAAGTILAAGSHQLSATFMPTDTVDYSAKTVHVTLQVLKATPVISWTPAPLQIGSKLGAAQLDATANVPGKFVYTPASGTVINSSTETLKVVFTPTNTTNYNSVTKTVSLTVTVVSVSPLSIDFGTVYLNSVTTKTVTVKNLGTASVTVSSPLISILTAGDSREFVAANLCVKPLAPHASCTIQVSFVAGAFYHQQSASMSVKYNSAGSPQTVSLTALTIDPQVQLSPSSLSFSAQKVNTTSAAKTVKLTNSGATALTIKSLTLGGSDPKDFKETNNCPASLSAGSSCTLTVTFKPAAKGSRTAKLTLTDNAKNSPQSITLSGTGN